MEHCTYVLPNSIDLITFVISRPENEECMMQTGWVGGG